MAPKLLHRLQLSRCFSILSTTPPKALPIVSASSNSSVPVSSASALLPVKRDVRRRNRYRYKRAQTAAVLAAANALQSALDVAVTSTAQSFGAAAALKLITASDSVPSPDARLPWIVEMSPSDTVGTLAANINEANHVDPESQHLTLLTFKGRPLDANRALKKCRLKKNSIIRLTIKRHTTRQLLKLTVMSRSKDSISFDLGPRYSPGPAAAGAIVQAAVDGAPPYLRADVGVLAMDRLYDEYALKRAHAAPAYAAVARAAAHDAHLPSCSWRALSVIAHLRKYSAMPTPEVIRACFDACVAGQNASAALALLDFARSAGFFSSAYDSVSLSSNLSGTVGDALPRAAVVSARRSSNAIEDDRPHLSEISYYNGIAHLFLCAGKYDAAETAVREISLRGLTADGGTLSVLAALYTARGLHVYAKRVFSALRNLGACPTPIAYAAMIHMAGSRIDSPIPFTSTSTVSASSAAWSIFKEFSTRLSSDMCMRLSEALPAATALSSHDRTRATASATSTNSDDIVLAMFQVLRTAKDAEGAVNLLKLLREQHDVSPPLLVYSLVIETCWRVRPQRLDLAESVKEWQRVQAMDAPLALEPFRPPYTVGTGRGQSNSLQLSRKLCPKLPAKTVLQHANLPIMSSEQSGSRRKAKYGKATKTAKAEKIVKAEKAEKVEKVQMSPGGRGDVLGASESQKVSISTNASKSGVPSKSTRASKSRKLIESLSAP